jgi:thioredoxin-related protein
MKILLAWLTALLTLLPAAARSAEPGAHAIDIPPWFAETFLDFREDVRDAAAAGKRVMLYFGQDGCPYCKELLQTNFSQPEIVEQTRRTVLPIALNIWGDRETVWIDGARRSEKDLARHLGVQFTPTLLFLDEAGRVVARINGYYPPHRFAAALRYVAEKGERREPFDRFMRGVVHEGASPKLHDQPFFLKPPYDLRRKPGAKPLAVLFETRRCAPCDELHRDGFSRKDLRERLAGFDLVRLSLSDRAQLVAPDGSRLSGEQWARALRIAYTPSIVFFGAAGREVFRIEAYLRPFHLHSALEYVASGGYASEPSFQRYIQARAQRLREQGKPVEIWK